MRPRERSETGEQVLFRPRLDQIIDMKHPLVVLGRTVDWGLLEEPFGEVYTDDPGRPPLPTRLMAGLVRGNHGHRPTGRTDPNLAKSKPFKEISRRPDQCDRSALVRR